MFRPKSPPSLSWLALLLTLVFPGCGQKPDESRTAQVYEADRPVRVLNEGDDLTFPTLLPDFRVRVGRFFE